MGFEEEAHLYQGCILLTWFITVDVDLDDLTEPVLVRFFGYEVTIPLSTLYSLKGSNYVQPTFKKWGVNYENC